jgi:hypothetical protein
LQRSEQVFTSSQSLAHFFRHENGRPQEAQIFRGRSAFRRILGMWELSRRGIIGDKARVGRFDPRGVEIFLLALSRAASHFMLAGYPESIDRKATCREKYRAVSTGLGGSRRERQFQRPGSLLPVSCRKIPLAPFGVGQRFFGGFQEKLPRCRRLS